MKIKTSDVKEYTQYVMNEYRKINYNAEHSSIGVKLVQFIKEGRIKDFIYKNESIESKYTMIELLTERIEEFQKSRGLDISLFRFKDFLKIKYRDEIIDEILS